MSTATQDRTAALEQKREGMPETWPVETRNGGPIFSDQLREDLRSGGVVRALEVLADVQAAVYEHLERAYEKLDHEGVRHSVGFTIEHVRASKRDLRKVADLYWMEREEEVEVSEWPYTGITYRVEEADEDPVLDGEGVREMVTDLYRINHATTLDKDSDEAEIRRRLDAISKLSEALADRLCEVAGIPVHDGTIQGFLDAARPFRQKAAKLGRDAVDTDRGES